MCVPDLGIRSRRLGGEDCTAQQRTTQDLGQQLSLLQDSMYQSSIICLADFLRLLLFAICSNSQLRSHPGSVHDGRTEAGLKGMAS